MVDQVGPGLIDRREDAVSGPSPVTGRGRAGLVGVSDDGQGWWWRWWCLRDALFEGGQGKGGREEQLLPAFTRDPVAGGPDPPQRDAGGASIPRPARHHVAAVSYTHLTLP